MSKQNKNKFVSGQELPPNATETKEPPRTVDRQELIIMTAAIAANSNHYDMTPVAKVQMAERLLAAIDEKAI